ncbi:MAG TPA: SxtJ family membrane protein [Gemmataceae bacterium]|nr:SxtJ family membrane protein [Gemmataceae bacterium]
MQWSDIMWAPDRRTLRQFAGLWVGFFLLLAAWHGFAQGRWALAAALAALAVTVGPAGLLWPRLLRPVFVTWMVVAFPVGWLVTHLVLAALFYGLFTPIGWAFRLWGRDVLALRRPAGVESYWAPKPQVTEARRYLRQF